MWFRESDDWTVENCGFHGAAHHGVGEEGSDAVVGVGGVGITEVFLEGLPVHAVICLEETEVGEQPVGNMSGNHDQTKRDGRAYSSSLFKSGVPVKHHL
jgi:hypothetical protein